MGKTASRATDSSFSVVSLNTSGILTSPYEYFEKEGNQEQQSLSNIFKALVTLDDPEFGKQKSKFNWQMGIIDTKWKNRFSPFNIIDVGVKYNYQLMTEKEFSVRWREIQKATKSTIDKYIIEKYKTNIKEEDLKLTESKMIQLPYIQKIKKLQVDQAEKFDFYCYQALLLKYCVDDFKDSTQTMTKEKIEQLLDKIVGRKFYDLKEKQEGEYNKNQNDQKVVKQTRQKNAQKYLNKKKESFNKYYYLVEQIKLYKTLKIMKDWDYDIIFLQQVSITFLNGLKTTENYHLISRPPSNSIIMINLRKYTEKYNYQMLNKQFIDDFFLFLKEDKDQQILTKQEISKCALDNQKKILVSKFNLNQESIFQYFDKLILFNVHLNSTKQKYRQQLYSFFQLYATINRFVSTFTIQDTTNKGIKIEKYRGCRVVMGGDLNNHLYFNKICHIIKGTDLDKQPWPPLTAQDIETLNNGKLKNLHYFPRYQSQQDPNRHLLVTVRKKRTYMQPQRGKANKIDSTTKDFIFSNCPIINPKITILDGSQITKDSKQKSNILLPTENHPYDHFMIYTSIEQPRRL